MNGFKVLGFNTYEEYIKSEFWKEKAEWIKEVFNNTCQVCGSKKNLHVHHLNYLSVGNEKQKDVTVLCLYCHKKAHDKKEEREDDSRI